MALSLNSSLVVRDAIVRTRLTYRIPVRYSLEEERSYAS